jgi:hypothetical protein
MKSAGFSPVRAGAYELILTSNINHDTFKSVPAPMQKVRQVPQEGLNYEKHHPQG